MSNTTEKIIDKKISQENKLVPESKKIKKIRKIKDEPKVTENISDSTVLSNADSLSNVGNIDSIPIDDNDEKKIDDTTIKEEDDLSNKKSKGRVSRENVVVQKFLSIGFPEKILNNEKSRKNMKVHVKYLDDDNHQRETHVKFGKEGKTTNVKKIKVGLDNPLNPNYWNVNYFNKPPEERYAAFGKIVEHLGLPS